MWMKYRRLNTPYHWVMYTLSKIMIIDWREKSMTLTIPWICLYIQEGWYLRNRKISISFIIRKIPILFLVISNHLWIIAVALEEPLNLVHYKILSTMIGTVGKEQGNPFNIQKELDHNQREDGCCLLGIWDSRSSHLVRKVYLKLEISLPHMEGWFTRKIKERT